MLKYSLFVSMLILAGGHPFAQEADSLIGGGAGTFFEVVNDSVNVSVSASASVYVTVEAVPDEVLLRIYPDEAGREVQFTVNGLEPHTPYFKYTNVNEAAEAVAADGTGAFNFSLIINEPNLVILRKTPLSPAE